MTFLLKEYRNGKTVNCGKLESPSDAKKWVAKKYTRFCVVVGSASSIVPFYKPLALESSHATN